MMRSILLISILVLSPFAYSTPLGITNNQDNANIIIYALPYDFYEFSYFTADSYATSQWLSTVTGPLYKRSIDTKFWIPELADGEPIISNNGLTWTVDLKSDLKFSNGEELTAEDVKFTYEMALNPKINLNTYGRMNIYLNNQTPVSIVDSNTVSFNFDKKYVFGMNLLNVPILPKTLYSDQYQDCIGGNDDACYFNSKDGSDTISAGPFKVHSITGNEEIVVIKNPYYYDAENVNLDKIIFIKIPEFRTALNALENHYINLLDSQYVPQFDDIGQNSEIEHELTGDAAHQEISINHLHPYYGTGELVPDNGTKIKSTNNSTQARYIRKAMSHIYDREYIVDNLWDGRGTPATTTLPPISIGYDDTILPDEYNITKARQLMEYAGFNFSGLEYDNITDTYLDQFFNITVLTPNSSVRSSFAPIWIDELTKIGIGVTEHVSTGWDVIIPRTFGYEAGKPPLYEEGGFDILFVGYSWGLDWDPSDLYHPDGFCDTGNCDNFYNYNNKTVAKQVDEYTSSFNTNDRLQHVVDLQKMLAHELPVIPLFHPSSLWSWYSGVEGLNTELLSASQMDWAAVDGEYIEYDPYKIFETTTDSFDDTSKHPNTSKSETVDSNPDDEAIFTINFPFFITLIFIPMLMVRTYRKRYKF